MRDTVQEEGFSPPDFVVDTATPADESSELEPTVFVVDDDLKTRELLCLLMASAGIHAEAYPSASIFGRLRSESAGLCIAGLFDAWNERH